MQTSAYRSRVIRALLAIGCTLLISAARAQAGPNEPATAASSPAPRDVDVPFVVSAPVVTRTMLEMARVEKNDFVIDLGSGDGRIVFLAAQKYGARGLGVEIDPRLVETAVEDTQKLKLGGRVNFRVQNLFETDLSPANVITMYLLPEVNLQLREKLLQLKPGTRVVSHDWDMGDWQADEMRVVPNPEKSLGLEKTSKVFLWVVPAQLTGSWCGTVEPPKGSANKSTDATVVSLELAQRFQQLTGTMKLFSTAKSVARQIPIRSNVLGNRFVIGWVDQDIVVDADADGLGLTLFSDEPRPRHVAGLDSNSIRNLQLMPLFQRLPLAGPVRLKRGIDCTKPMVDAAK